MHSTAGTLSTATTTSYPHCFMATQTSQSYSGSVVMFVHKYVSSQSLLNPSFKKEMRSWQLRARLAMALIEMAEALEHTQYSRLYMCDVNESTGEAVCIS